MVIRPDLIFSYWIFVWFLLYWCKITTYNPKYLLIIGIVENLITIIISIYYKTSFVYIFYFIVIMIIMKLIPLYLVWNNYNNIADISVSIFIFMLYDVWLIINKTNVIIIQEKILDSIIKEKNRTPVLWLINEMINK